MHKRPWISVFLKVALFYSCLLWTFRSKPLVAVPRSIAHRGAAGLAPENTLAAIQQGIAQGMSLIEVDVRRSADGHLVLMHDNAVNRVTSGTGKIGELTWAQLQALRVQGKLAGSSGESIPQLSDALALTMQANVMLIIEVKDPYLYPEIAQDLLTVIDQCISRNCVVIVSFAKEWLQTFHQLAPDVRIGQLAVWTIRGPQQPTIHVIDLWWVNVLFDPTLIRRMHRKNCFVWVWTVDIPVIMRLLYWLGVDGVTTNRPDLWRASIK